MSLAGRSIIVTGAGSGIGRCIAIALAGADADVTAVGRRAEPLEKLRADAPGLSVVCADVTEPGSPRCIVEAAVDRFGRLDGLVNNAGTALFAGLDEAEPAQLEAMLAVNVCAPAELIREALPYLRRDHGAVVNVTSVGGSLAMPGRSYYGASKAALNSLTRSLAVELAPEIRVNAVLPGPIDTPMWSEAGLTAAQKDDLRAGMAASTPMARFGTGDEVAFWVSHLLDPAVCGWVTGALIPVDGGRTA